MDSNTTEHNLNDDEDDDDDDDNNDRGVTRMGC